MKRKRKTVDFAQELARFGVQLESLAGYMLLTGGTDTSEFLLYVAEAIDNRASCENGVPTFTLIDAGSFERFAALVGRKKRELLASEQTERKEA